MHRPEGRLLAQSFTVARAFRLVALFRGSESIREDLETSMSVAFGQILPRRGETTECPVCKKLFYRYSSQVKAGIRLTCSRTCAARHFRDNGEHVPCEKCGKIIYRSASRAARRFCSHLCELLSRHKCDVFIRTRENVFKERHRREWMEVSCARCGSTEELQLDHVKPRFLGGTATRDNAQTLCGPCNRTKFWRDEYPLYRAMLKAMR